MSKQRHKKITMLHRSVEVEHISGETAIAHMKHLRYAELVYTINYVFTKIVLSILFSAKLYSNLI